jgi:hypothetical protein
MSATPDVGPQTTAPHIQTLWGFLNENGTEPVRVHCPICAGVIDEIANPSLLVRWTGHCDNCRDVTDIALGKNGYYLWEVAVSSLSDKTPGVKCVQSELEQVWSRWLSRGVRINGLIRQREVEERIRNLSRAMEYVELSPHCPLCLDEYDYYTRPFRPGATETWLDYHHLIYGPDDTIGMEREVDVGIMVCRDCHDAIHDGAVDKTGTEKQQVELQSWEATKAGYVDGWMARMTGRAYIIYYRTRNEDPAADLSFDAFVNCMNIPVEQWGGPERVRAWIRTVWDDDISFIACPV